MHQLCLCFVAQLSGGFFWCKPFLQDSVCTVSSPCPFVVIALFLTEPYMEIQHDVDICGQGGGITIHSPFVTCRVYLAIIKAAWWPRPFSMLCYNLAALPRIWDASFWYLFIFPLKFLIRFHMSGSELQVPGLQTSPLCSHHTWEHE